MKRNKFLFGFIFTAILSLMMGSCSKEDNVPETTEPRLESLGIADNTKTAVNQSVVFNPFLSSENTDVSYSWVVNGEKTSDQKNYTFTPSSAGTYTIALTVTNSAGSDTQEITIAVYQYLGGLYIINEGTATGTLNYYDPESETFAPQVYSSLNEGKTLGITSQYGTFWNGRIYIVSKDTRPLIGIDAMTLKECAALEGINNARSFCGINETTGILSTASGAYRVTLDPMVLGSLLPGTEETECRDLLFVNGTLFVISKEKGLLIYDTNNDFELKKTVADVQIGLAQTPDGNVWTVKNDNILLKVNPETLETEETTLPNGITIPNNWGVWRSSPFCAAHKENALYFFNYSNGEWGDVNSIYKYKVGDIGSLNAAFATSSQSDDNFYGTFRIDPETDDLYVTSIQSGWGENSKNNRLLVFDGETGAENNRYTYDTQNYWFPSFILFNMQ